jgi:hypothetical protein
MESKGGTVITEPPANKGGVEHVIILIHGMWSYATWAQAVAEALGGPNIQVVAPRYGWYSIPRFVAPWFAGAAAQQRVYREFLSAKREHPDAKISVIAHSLGTFLFTRILKEYQDIQVWRAILCGSVVKQDFEWERVAAQLGEKNVPDKTGRIVNDCGNRDWLPVLAAWTGFRYGNAGTDGFGSTYVVDRFHAGGHGLFFDPGFISEYWKPFIDRGYPESGKANQGEGVPWYFRWALRVRLPLLLVIVAAIIAAIIFWPRRPDRIDMDFATFTREFNEVRNHPTAFATFKKQYNDDTFEYWTGYIYSVIPGDKPIYLIAPTVNARLEDQAYASFASHKSQFNEAIKPGTKVEIRGAVDDGTAPNAVILRCDSVQRVD